MTLIFTLTRITVGCASVDTFNHISLVITSFVLDLDTDLYSLVTRMLPMFVRHNNINDRPAPQGNTDQETPERIAMDDECTDPHMRAHPGMGGLGRAVAFLHKECT